MKRDNSVNIKQVAQSALQSSESVLSHWLPDGKRQGVEWQAINPKRADAHTGSFSVNINTGRWSDFATGDKGGDLISLVAWLDDCSQTKAAKSLALFLGIDFRVGTSGTTGNNSSNSLNDKKKSVNSNSKTVGTSAEKGGNMFPFLPFSAQVKPPVAHIQLGKPSARWVYRNEKSRPIMQVCRFETDKGKETRPLIYTKDGYRWKALPAPRPLYNLDKITNKPDVLVIVCEGEKAADAAQLLFPVAVTTTPPNGAQSPHKASWKPVAGHQVRIWPDADKPGEGFAKSVAKLVFEAGAVSVDIMDLSSFLILPNKTKREVLPKGWDAADALEDGYTSDHLTGMTWVRVSQETKQVARIEPPEESDNKRPYFHPTEDGVYYYDLDKDSKDFQRQWICSQLFIPAYTRDERGENWGRLLVFQDRDGASHRWAMPMLLLKGSGEELRGELLRLGVEISTNQKARRLLGDYLQQWRPEHRARCVSRTGWFGDVFVFPESTIGEKDERIIFQTEYLHGFTYRQRGELDDWREHVSRYCVGNSRLVFAVSAAFASMLIESAGDESGGFHYRGGSSSGKTTALKVAASVYGAPDYVQKWRATSNGLEAVAEQHNDTLLILDELAQVDPRDAGETAYLLANGSGKARAGRNGYAREVKQWRLLFLSAGELGLAEHMLQVGKKVKAGQEIRMADIPADAGKELGVFDDIQGHENGAVFSRKLIEASSKYYGVASLEFIEQAIKKKHELQATIRKVRDGFIKEVLNDKDASGQAERVAARFGLVAVAGELATAWGITGWKVGEAERAARICFDAWVNGRGGTGKTEATNLLDQVRHFFELNGEARFTPYDRAEDDHAPRTSNRAGFVKREGGRFIYMVFPEVFKREVCQGFDHREAEEVLVSNGWMKKGNCSRGHQRKETLPGSNSRKRCYVFDMDCGTD